MALSLSSYSYSKKRELIDEDHSSFMQIPEVCSGNLSDCFDFTATLKGTVVARLVQ